MRHAGGHEQRVVSAGIPRDQRVEQVGGALTVLRRGFIGALPPDSYSPMASILARG